MATEHRVNVEGKDEKRKSLISADIVFACPFPFTGKARVGETPPRGMLGSSAQGFQLPQKLHQGNLLGYSKRRAKASSMGTKDLECSYPQS